MSFQRGIFERFHGILHEGEKYRNGTRLGVQKKTLWSKMINGHMGFLLKKKYIQKSKLIFSNRTLISFESKKRYEELKKNILGEESEDEQGSNAAASDSNGEDESDEDEEEHMDETGTNLVNLCRTIY